MISTWICLNKAGSVDLIQKEEQLSMMTNERMNEDTCSCALICNACVSGFFRFPSNIMTLNIVCVIWYKA